MEKETPFYWPCVAIGLTLVTAYAVYLGAQAPSVARAVWVPEIITWLSAGAGLLSLPAYGLGFVPLAIGATLGAPRLRDSLFKIALGALLMATPMTLANWWTGIASLSGEIPANGISPAVPKLLYSFAMIPLLLFTWKPFVLAAGALAVVGHLALDALNDLPLPWQRLNSGDSGVAFETGAGVFVMAAALWTFFPELHTARDPLKDEGASVEEIVAALHPPILPGPMIKTQKGRANMRKFMKEVDEALDAARKEPCDNGMRLSLKYAANRYFDYIRIYEDWKPDVPLSEISREALLYVEQGLKSSSIGWDDLVPATRIHLNKEKFGAAKRVFPVVCTQG